MNRRVCPHAIKTVLGVFGAVMAAALVSCSATYSLDQLQGAWWSDFKNPTADFAINGNAEGEEWTMGGYAVFAEEVYRTPLSTPKPRIFGVQSAAVVGPSGQEIYTDEFGRVRVQFPWDRLGKSNDDSSCWMRARAP